MNRTQQTLFLSLMGIFVLGSAYGTIDSRVAITISCRDCDYIPKVANAGDVITVDGTKVQVMHNGIYVKHGVTNG